MISINHKAIIACLFCLCAMIAQAQNLKFHVVSFEEDPFDLSARSEQYQEVDGSGSLYAVVKVTSDTSDDDVKAYQYDFGMMAHKVKEHNGEIWVYVQKNAKTVTIMRQGYQTVSRYDLGTTIESGKNYKLVLSAQGPKVYMQWVQFTVKPADSQAFITITREGGNGQEESLGAVNAQGKKAKSLPYGTYNYKVISENYYTSEGRFQLDNQDVTYQEEIELRPRFSTVTLRVDADADIYVNGEQKGRRTWTGPLNAGVYQVECRQQSHRPSSQSITVEENTSRTYDLTIPTPITGTLSLSSEPLGANIKIDGKDYGATPCNISNLLIGQHSLILRYAGHYDESQIVEVKENETTEVSVVLNNIPVLPDEQTFTVKGVSFVMKHVAGGTFQMGATSEQGDDAEYDEIPVHSVTLSDYYIGETEVTQALWQAVMGTTIRQWRDKVDMSYSLCGEGANYPMYYISWNDCQEFVRKLNAQTGQSFRLPTEAEWEYAARGGKKSHGYKYSGGNNVKSVAWLWENSGDTPLSGEWDYDKISNNNCNTHPVKTKQANELGLYDMSGNVWEWCQDGYGPYSSSAQTNPMGPSSDYTRVYRGGSWYNEALDCRVSERYDDGAPSECNGTVGLRLALPANTISSANTPMINESTKNVEKTTTSHPEEKTYMVNDVSFTMKRVEGGTFRMGATSEQGGEAKSDESPVHSVTLSDYYIGETEVTQALWQAVMGTTIRQQRDKANTSWPLRGEGANYPMYYISWEECQEFVRKLNVHTGQRFRLPTEAEWEYAARGGKKSHGYKYSGGNTVKSVAWLWENSGDAPLSGEWYSDKVFNNNCRTHPVKTKQANELGLYDMSGNVWEWCQDWYGNYSSNAQTNPTGPASGSDRVRRGGSWHNHARSCRVSYRNLYSPSGGSQGLRLAQ